MPVASIRSKLNDFRAPAVNPPVKVIRPSAFRRVPKRGSFDVRSGAMRASAATTVSSAVSSSESRMLRVRHADLEPRHRGGHSESPFATGAADNAGDEAHASAAPRADAGASRIIIPSPIIPSRIIPSLTGPARRRRLPLEARR